MGDVAFVLGAGDRVGVVVFKRADLSGEFRVTPHGMLALPFIGAVPVAGLSLPQAQERLVGRLRDEAFLLDPRVSLELVEGQPIFVAGAVSRPGAYPFQPAMTVLRALAAAGGVRTVAADDVNARLAVSQIREKLRQSQQTIGLALIRRTRLAAERDGQDDYVMPAEARNFLSEAKARDSFESERALLRQRNTAFRTQIELSNTEVAGFRDEMAALTDQTAAKQREAELALQESRYVDNLQRQGLTPRSSRVNELQRLAVQLDGERSQIGAALARAREEIARVGETVNTLANQRQVELLGAMKDADDAVSAAQIVIEEARAALAQLRLSQSDGGPPVYTVERTRGDTAGRIQADSATPLLPGDLVIVADAPATAP